MIVGRGEVVGSSESGGKTGEEGFTGLAGKLLNSVQCTVVQNIGLTGMVVCVTPPDGAWTEYVSGGVTLLRISSTKHKERPLRDS
nr:hypothetical protein [Tanacetum cinerariifolium]